MGELEPWEAGEYQVRVHIDQCKDLQPKDSDGAQPIVKIILIGTNAKPDFWFTEVQDNPRDCIWDENKQFSFKVDNVSELEQAKIKYEVYDYNAATKNELIGSFQYDMQDVWEAPDDPNDDDSFNNRVSLCPVSSSLRCSPPNSAACGPLALSRSGVEPAVAEQRAMPLPPCCPLPPPPPSRHRRPASSLTLGRARFSGCRNCANGCLSRSPRPRKWCHRGTSSRHACCWRLANRSLQSRRMTTTTTKSKSRPCQAWRKTCVPGPDLALLARPRCWAQQCLCAAADTECAHRFGSCWCMSARRNTCQPWMSWAQVAASITCCAFCCAPLSCQLDSEFSRRTRRCGLP